MKKTACKKSHATVPLMHLSTKAWGDFAVKNILEVRFKRDTSGY
jgi:hypothetical protein